MKLPALRSAVPAIRPAIVRAAWGDARASAFQNAAERFPRARERAAAISSYLFPHSAPLNAAGQEELMFADFPPGQPSFTAEAVRATLVLVGTVVALLVGTLPALWWAVALQYLDAVN